jgi:putative transposase
MALGDRITEVKFVLRDRDSRFTTVFDVVFAAEGIRMLVSPSQAPQANAICERMIGALRRELFDRLLIVSERHLRTVLLEYLHHYNQRRPHRALDQLTPTHAESQPAPVIHLAGRRIRRRRVLDGVTSECYIAA